jgi:acyl carrier protein
MSQLCTVEIVISMLHTKVGVPLETPNIDTASWEELGVESLGLSELFATLEHDLGINISFQDALSTKNVQELVAMVNSCLVLEG